MRNFHKMKAEEITEISLREHVNVPPSQPSESVAADPTLKSEQPTRKEDETGAFPEIVKEDQAPIEEQPPRYEIKLLGGERKSILKRDLLLAPAVEKRNPIVGDFLIEDYDIMTDEPVFKVYDRATFQRWFKASLN